jgi:GNAT superfamily N-acetyltransferase
VTVRNLESFFRPDRVAVLGAPRTAGQRQLFSNLAASLPADRRVIVGAAADDWHCIDADHAGIQVDLAVAFDGRLLRPDMLAWLSGRGCRGLVWATDVPVSREARLAARNVGLRVLGARSAGVAAPGHGFNGCAYVPSPAAGRLALVAQSRTIAAAALDWARGRNLGFSWLAVSGAEADVDVADLLDYAAVDPATSGVVVQLAHVADGRQFMSAARAAARVKPVAILQTRAADAVLKDGVGPDPVRSAAFARAGLVECEKLSGLFESLEALDRLSALGNARVVVVSNGAGLCALAVNALSRHGIVLPDVASALQSELRRRLPLARFIGGAVDVGSLPPDKIVAAVNLLIEHGVADAVLLVHSPEPGQPHEDVARAISESPHAARVLTVWLGLATARQARVISASRGVATFPSLDDAAYALATLHRHRRTQELLTQTPPLWEGHTVRQRRVDAILARLGAAGGDESKRAQAVLALLAEYGVGRAAGLRRSGPGIRVAIRRHAEFGTYLSVQAQAGLVEVPAAYGFPPLDGLLARRLLEAAGLQWAEPNPSMELLRLSLALLRLANLAIEQPRIASLQVCVLASPDETQCRLAEASAQVDDDPPPERRRLALAPYPNALSHSLRAADGRVCWIRAIRPEDEPAFIRMLESTDPDAIRLRFFHAIRHFSHTMAARLTQVDYDRELGLIALAGDEPGGDAVGLAHLIADADGTQAEFAILVHQSQRGAGLGRHLMENLLDFAAARGIKTVYGDVLAENRPMLALCRALGFTIRLNPGDPSSQRVEIDPARFKRDAQEAYLLGAPLR